MGYDKDNNGKLHIRVGGETLDVEGSPAVLEHHAAAFYKVMLEIEQMKQGKITLTTKPEFITK